MREGSTALLGGALISVAALVGCLALTAAVLGHVAALIVLGVAVATWVLAIFAKRVR